MTPNQMLILAFLAIALMGVGAWLLLGKRQTPEAPEQSADGAAQPPMLQAAEADEVGELRASREQPVELDVPMDWSRDAGAAVPDEAAIPTLSVETAPAVTAPAADSEPVDALAPVAALESALDTLDQATSRLAPPVEAMPVAASREDSDLLERHLEEQQLHDESTPLAQAERILCFYLLPASGRRFDGARIKNLLVQSGLLFGEMSLFHRFEEPDGQGALMFSVLRFDPVEGPSAFDLESIESEKFAGLAFFLALPNAQAVKGYDMMCSILRNLAAELGADVFDEQMQLLSKQLREHYRHQVIDYRVGQPVT